jgi:hypothetical protein
MVTRTASSATPPGASSTGCLLTLLIFVAALYYGVNIGEVYFRYYRLVDEMDEETRFAATLDNGTIQRRIATAVKEIGLPDSAGQVDIRRSVAPRQISISTDYSETLDLPLFRHTFVFHPQSIQPL